jgi:hypothetical protein
LSKITRRGYDDEDSKWFSDESIEQLATAQQEIQYLLDRGYKMKPVIEMVGGHYQFSARQRTALQRATSAQLKYDKRRSTMLDFDEADKGCINVDAFNLIITLEVALSGSVLVLGKDGVLRDLAGLRGTYSIIDKTDAALSLIGRTLKKLSVPSVKFYLDSPVSNSGRLKAKILEHAHEWGIHTEAELVPNADVVLDKMERIVTSDSIILDRCGSWFNMSRKIVEDYIIDAWIVSLNK